MCGSEVDQLIDFQGQTFLDNAPQMTDVVKKIVAHEVLWRSAHFLLEKLSQCGRRSGLLPSEAVLISCLACPKSQVRKVRLQRSALKAEPEQGYGIMLLRSPAVCCR